MEAHKEDSCASGYPHLRMEAKRHALDELVARQRGVTDKRQTEAERASAGGATASHSAVLQISAELFLPYFTETQIATTAKMREITARVSACRNWLSLRSFSTSFFSSLIAPLDALAGR